MILTLDFGNTKIKAVVFKQFTIVKGYVFDTENIIKSISEIIKNHPEIVELLIVSVRNQDFTILQKQFNCLTVHIINRQFYFPFKNNYKTPDTVGLDRLVLVGGAVLQFPKKNRLIIDAGSCITYDFVDCEDQYFGGAISPGVQMRYKSVNHFTDKLPFLELSDLHAVIGNTTNSSIHSGIINGVLFEIEGFIKSYRDNYDDLTVILTGGDGDFLAKRLKNSIFADHNFLAKSLIAIYQNKTSHDKKDHA